MSILCNENRNGEDLRITINTGQQFGGVCFLPDLQCFGGEQVLRLCVVPICCLWLFVVRN
jgi:hypothetical protein